MKIFILCCSLPLFVLLFENAFWEKVAGQTGTVTAGQKFKNIKVLNDMPADQMGKVMNIMSASLGVDCNFCHISETEFDKDGKKEKDIARKMIAMTFMLNKDYFDGKLEVTCNTCHQGHSHPVSAISLPSVISPPRKTSENENKLRVDTILETYVKALGGKAALGKIKTRVIKARRIEADGKTTETEDVYLKAPNRSLMITAYGKYLVTEGYDGTAAWKRGDGENIALYADEAEQIKREAELFDVSNIKTIYAQMVFNATDKIKDREVYVVRATTAAGQRERLYFDVQTGLLVRRTASIMTVLGVFQFQVDYEDYKAFDGVKIPMTTRWSMPNLSWTRKALTVKNNIPIDDAKFENK
ncbi:MAG TPA: c-type cytochrome [Pyrinomonadaceae bacterium]|nr:c-type cytochrome [Pyrinomonadaceae bacterium]